MVAVPPVRSTVRNDSGLGSGACAYAGAPTLPGSHAMRAASTLNAMGSPYSWSRSICWRFSASSNVCLESPSATDTT